MTDTAKKIKAAAWAAGQPPTPPSPPPPATNPPAGKLWSFSLCAGWHLAGDPLPAAWDDYDEALEQAGFESFATLGDDCGTLSVGVYASQATGRFYFSLNTFALWQSFLAADLPSALELLAKLVPMVKAAAELDQITEAREEKAKRRRRGPAVYDASKRMMRYARAGE